LWVDERCLGTLSLYREQPAIFTSHDERITTLFATLAALALARAQRADQLRAALDNRDFIGQAKGILMHRDGITAEAPSPASRSLRRAPTLNSSTWPATLPRPASSPAARTPD
jgi:hypothetical protein